MMQMITGLVALGLLIFSADARAASNSLRSIEQDGRILFGMYLGFQGLSFNERGQPVGLEVELADLVAKEISVLLGKPIRAEIVDQEWGQIIKVLRDGKYDAVLSALIPNPLYNQYNIAYTRSYLDTGPVVTSQERDGVSATGVGPEVATLAGRRVVVINDPAVRKVLREVGVYVAADDGKTDLERAFPRAATEAALAKLGRTTPLIEVKEVLQLDEMDVIYRMLAEGTVDAGVIDLGIIWYVAQDSRRYARKIIAYPQPIGPYIYSAVTRAEDQDLHDLLDQAIGRVRETPEYRAILSKWHGGTFQWNLTPADFLK